MSLLEEMTVALDAQGEYGDAREAADEVGAVFVIENLINATRWGHIVEEIFRRNDEHVGVCYEAGSGDSDIPFEPEVYSVVAKEVTTTTYVKVD